MSMQEETLFVCDKCPYTSPRKEHLASHKKNKHPAVIEELHCLQCDYVTFNAEYLRKHVKRKHAPCERFRCPHEGCDFSTVYRTNLRAHVKRMHDAKAASELRMTCDLCGFSTLYVFSYNKHRETMHGLTRAPNALLPYQSTYACPHCPFEHTRQYVLAQHMKKMHPVTDTNKEALS